MYTYILYMKYTYVYIIYRAKTFSSHESPREPIQGITVISLYGK